jgi:TonB family protein
MFDPDAANPTPAEDARAKSERHPPVEDVPDKLDLVELAEKFTVHGGGQVSAQVSTDLALDLVLNQIVEQTCLATPASGAAIVLARGGEWVCRASAGGNSPTLGARLDAEAGLSGECIKTRQIQRCDDAQSDPRADIEACRSLGIRSVLILPLLQDDQLVGVFEAFSSQPATFGKRDENTLEVLSQRVLANLKQTSQTLSLFTEISPPEPAEASYERPGNPVVENSNAEIPIVENAIEDTLIASDHTSKPTLNAASENATIPEATSEIASISGINILTWILGAAVLAFALLLTVLLGVRLSRGRSGSRAHPRTDVSAKLNDAGQTPAPGASETDATKIKETGTNLAAKSRSGFAGSANTSESRGTAVATLPHPTSALQAGSLQVFEKGKEIFRMSPATEQSQQSKVGAKNGTTSSNPSGAVEQTPVEPAAIYELPPEAASQSLVHRVEPEYPQEALEQQIQGPVALDVRIGRDGTVQAVKLVSGQPLLAEAAMAAVKQWQFKPHLTKGQAVEMQTKVILNFRLPR